MEWIKVELPIVGKQCRCQKRVALQSLRNWALHKCLDFSDKTASHPDKQYFGKISDRMSLGLAIND
jgi:hypothetical protein